MSEKVLQVEIKDQVAVITLNRPEIMNSFNFELLLALKDAIDDIRFDPDIRVVIITGSGERAFCAGADLKERITLTPPEVKKFIYTIRTLFTDIESLSKPVIVGLTEARLAIIPGAGGTQRLPRLIGRGKAKELILTGRRVDAAEALDINLVNKICEKEVLMDEARKMAAMICECGPIAVEQAKYAINAGLETDLHTGLNIESNAYWITIPTEDRLEGLAAFREKRKPVYKGK